MKLTPLQKRAERKARHNNGLDMNLVALIDIFTILIFFLMSSTGVEVLTSHRSVKLPESSAEKLPHETIVVTVSATEILVGGRAVARVSDALASDDDLIAPLKSELELQAGRSVLGADGSAKSQAVTILGDKAIPYRLLRKVMVTAARANFSDVAFAVTRKATT
jgi:biopolymer transport protein TolR